jgi:hypothetical protein
MSDSAPSPPPSLRPLGLLWRFAAMTLLVWSALGLYFSIALSVSTPQAAVVMPAWVPFWPVFALPYISLLFIAWLLPLAIRDAGRFLSCAIAIVIAFLLIAPWWLLIPTRMDRPPTPDGWWLEPYRWIAMVDPPHCVLPCGHGLGPTVAAWFVALERPAWRGPLIAMLLLGLPSIAFVGQHRPIDILIGEAAAAVGIIVAQAWHRRTRAQIDHGRRAL